MDFTLNSEQRQISEYGGQLARSFDHAYWLDHARRHAFPLEMFQQIAKDGFLGMMAPEDYGGEGLGMTEMAFASERNLFGQPIGAHQGVQNPMAKAYTNIKMASLMARRAAWEFDSSLPTGASTNMAKYAVAEAGIEAVDDALQAHGGSGFTEETGPYEQLYPLVRLLRTAPVNRELCLSFVGEKVMGLPRSY